MTDPEIAALVERLLAVEALDFVPHAVPVELCRKAASALTRLAAEKQELVEALSELHLRLDFEKQIAAGEPWDFSDVRPINAAFDKARAALARAKGGE